MIFFFVSLTTYICFIILKYQKNIISLEESKYNLKKYNKWIIDNKKDNFLSPELLFIILIIIIFNCDVRTAGISVVIFYMLLYLYELKKKEKSIKLKGKNIGISLVLLIIFLGVFLALYLGYDYSQLVFDGNKLYYLIIIFLGYLSPYVVLISGFIVNFICTITSKIKKNKKKVKTKKKHNIK